MMLHELINFLDAKIMVNVQVRQISIEVNHIVITLEGIKNGGPYMEGSLRLDSNGKAHVENKC